MTGSPFTSAHQRSTSAINLTIALARSPYGTRTYVSTSAIQRDPGRLRARARARTHAHAYVPPIALDRAGAFISPYCTTSDDQRDAQIDRAGARWLEPEGIV